MATAQEVTRRAFDETVDSFKQVRVPGVQYVSLADNDLNGATEVTLIAAPTAGTQIVLKKILLSETSGSKVITFQDDAGTPNKFFDIDIASNPVPIMVDFGQDGFPLGDNTGFEVVSTAGAAGSVMVQYTTVTV